MRRIICAVFLAVTACAPTENPTVPASAIQDDAIPASLTGAFGHADRGEAIFVARDGGHCVLCHQVDGLSAEFQGNVGPDLTQVADRLTPAQIRLRIVDYQIVTPGAVMPSYYRRHDLYNVDEAHADKTILSAEQIEDLVAYLATLKEHK